MGNKVVMLSDEQLEIYQDCTFLKRKEILKLYTQFRKMDDAGRLPETMTPEDASRFKLPLSCLAKIPELRENPFRKRIAHVFTSSEEPGSYEGISFEEFLEMMSVFSEQAPRDLKVFYAFKIYDFDDDGIIGIEDLEKTCRALVGEDGLSNDEIKKIICKVLEECDIDCDSALSYVEFEQCVTRAADFMSTFHIRI